MTHIPAWAEAQFGPKADPTELVLLREFYEAWEAMHAITNETKNKAKVSDAADRMIQAANMVRRYREPRTVSHVLRP